MKNAHEILLALEAESTEEYALQLARFFKTGPGEYGEGDIFMGVRMPAIRSIVKKASPADWETIQELLESPLHEARMAGLLLLVNRYKKADKQAQAVWYGRYLESTQYINNWDLVDVTAPHVIGEHVATMTQKEAQTILSNMVASSTMWERRIAIVSTLTLIKQGKTKPTYKLAKQLLIDPHDLMHKATGWMLREAGKKDMDALYDFLQQHVKNMPRTMFRYAIERFPTKQRKEMMNW